MKNDSNKPSWRQRSAARSAAQRAAYARALSTEEGAKRVIRRGALLAGLGLVITIGTFVIASATGGGSFIISFGPILVGIVRVVQGSTALSKLRGANSSAVAQPGWSPVPPTAPGPAAPGSPALAPVRVPPAPGFAAGPSFPVGPPSLHPPTYRAAGPAAPGVSGPPPGWYADPAGSGQLRFFDGATWTTHLQARP